MNLLLCEWFHLNWFEDAIMLVAGAILGYYGAVIAERREEKRRWGELVEEAGVLGKDGTPGKYTAYCFKKDSAGGETTIPDFSHVTGKDDEVRHERDNIFTLVHNEPNGNVWKGTMYFDTPQCGIVVWQYTKLDGQMPTKELRGGFKRFSVSNYEHNGTKRCICLYGEVGFGKEILEKME